MTSLVVPMYGARDVVPRLVQSLRDNPTRPQIENYVEYIWVSDGDGAYAGLPGEQVVLKERGGFAVACNAGAKHAAGYYLCLLNADTWVTGGWLDELLAPLHTTPKASIVGPRILQPNGKIDSLGSALHMEHPGIWLHVGEGQDDYPDAHDRWVERDMITFACVLMPLKIWQELGGLDEGYERGSYEDSDFCMRARERGHIIGVAPQSVIYHSRNHAKIHDSTGDVYLAKNRQRYRQTWIDSGRQAEILGKNTR